jgi:IS30 family transposase
MYVWQSTTGHWELDFLTSQEKNSALRDAAEKVTGQRYILPSYDTRGEAMAAMAEIYRIYEQ